MIELTLVSPEGRAVFIDHKYITMIENTENTRVNISGVDGYIEVQDTPWEIFRKIREESVNTKLCPTCFAAVQD